MERREEAPYGRQASAGPGPSSGQYGGPPRGNGGGSGNIPHPGSHPWPSNQQHVYHPPHPGYHAGPAPPAYANSYYYQGAGGQGGYPHPQQHYGSQHPPPPQYAPQYYQQQPPPGMAPPYAPAPHASQQYWYPPGGQIHWGAGGVGPAAAQIAPSNGWQYHQVAPQQCQTKPRPPSRQRGAQGQKRADKAAAAATPPKQQQQQQPEVLECKTCEKTFKHRNQLKAHLSMHEVCGVKGCSFSAIPKVLKEHREKEHFKAAGKSAPGAKAASKAASLESEEEVRAYLAERRANYPTEANLKRKQEVDGKRREIGQLEPDSEHNKRMKRLKEVLQQQKKMGVAKLAGTDRMGAPGAGGGAEDKGRPDNPGAAKSHGGGGKRGGDQNQGGPRKKNEQQRHPRRKEESLVHKLLKTNIRKEKSHILQCFRFLVKTKFKMAFT